VSIPSAESQLAFLQNIQAVLEDGQFTATYKFALLIALADLAVEAGAVDDAPCRIPLVAVAGKFVEYYWQQSAPFSGAPGAEILLQNTFRQASVVNLLASARLPSAARPQGIATLAQLRADPARWAATIARVVHVIRVQPLHRLQVVAGHTRIFLYPHDGDPQAVELLQGVAYHLRRFHPLVTGLARDRWMGRVRSIPANQYAIGQAQDLERFLFGAERQPIGRYLPRLIDRQSGLCLYCGGALHSGNAHVDHFIPWSLHRFDALPNLVAAHGHCNLAKRDMLAAERHLERWVDRNARLDSANYGDAIVASAAGCETAAKIATWAYGRAFDIGAAAWVRGRQTEPLSGRFRSVLRG
jgi:5-methylcytosine-specific restriction endonuclease McrA